MQEIVPDTAAAGANGRAATWAGQDILNTAQLQLV